jgi:hypothetical protein
MSVSDGVLPGKSRPYVPNLSEKALQSDDFGRFLQGFGRFSVAVSGPFARVFGEICRVSVVFRGGLSVVR